MVEKQRTLVSQITVLGKGLHSGGAVTTVIKPAPADYGIRFVRTDLDGAPQVAALAENVVETSRSTVIAKGQARVSTIEHCMAALWGCGVDNAIVEVNCGEVPILDGSAREWVEAIEKVGTVELGHDRVYFDIPAKIVFAMEERGVRLEAYPDDKLSMVVNVNFDSKVVGMQYAVLSGVNDFATQVASCRTFVFFHELQPLIDANLIKGGDLDNAIVVVENALTVEEAKKAASLFNQQIGAISQAGYLAAGGLRFDNEIARHKMLDLCGDLALVGCHLRGRVFATRPGHKANTEFAKLLRKEIKAALNRPPIKYDANAVPLMDINAIKDMLPHRPPFLLVDKILELGKDYVIGVKQVTMNEPFFTGHFPQEPVMPGVLIVEAMAQCGGILALSSVPDPELYSTYFMKIDNVKFKRKVVPGDTLLFHLQLTEPIRRGIVIMRSRAFVGDELATEAELMAMVTKQK